MRKLILFLFMCSFLNTGFSQTKKIGFDSLWSFSYPEFIDIRTAIDSNLFISSTYTERKDMVFVFNEDSSSVKTYINDSLVESSYICEVIRNKKQITYKTHVKYMGSICEGHFTISYKNRWKRKIEFVTGGFSEPDIVNGFVCFHPRIIR